MDEYQAATLTTRYIALALTATQCLLLAIGLWMMNRANAGRDRQTMLAERRHNDAMKVHAERHAEAMKANAERHAEAMKAHETAMKAHEAQHAEVMSAHAEAMKAHEATMKAHEATVKAHEATMKANAERHAETMRGIEALIERTAAANRAGGPPPPDPKA